MEVASALEEEVYRLTKAILIRESGSNGGRGTAIASVHEVETAADGRCVIGEGQLLTEKGMAVLVKAVVPEQRMAFIDERVLATGVEGTVWWRKPAPAMMWFNTKVETDKIGARGGQAPQPGLVFVASRGRWMVLAVKGVERPKEDTPLFLPPFYNVYEDGRICVGNADVPAGHSVADIDGYERAFWGSRFTHPNITLKKRLSKYRGGAGALWLSLMSGRRKVFPEETLVPTKWTVGSLVKALAK